MANKNNIISTALKRNLQNGKEYDKLIPTVKCERTNLGDGDTFHTVDAMKNWIEKYSFQTQKLAPVLKGKSLEETVNNIYHFLYNHIQYTADGLLQQLRSPACTWKQRYDGVDCKSFSVAASSILCNLGINHMIRQVRQPGFHEDQFTHVYIVVPKNQNGKSSNSATFVLDATKHQNIEGNYIEKVDLEMNKMKHIGLNAPHDERTRQIVDNFNRFSRHLREVGVPANIVDGITNEINRYTSKGIDPKFRRVEGGITIENKFFPLNFTVDGEYMEGLGFVITGAAATAAAGKALDLLPPDFLNNTFGSIFANGFDMSCWNASYSESKATAALEIDIPFLLDGYSGLKKNPNTESLNKFLNGIAAYVSAAKNGQRSKYASCTRKGYALSQKGAEGALDQVLRSMKSSYNLIPTGKRQGSIETNMPSVPSRPYRWGAQVNQPYEYDSYRLEQKNVSSGSTNSGSNTGNNYSPTNGNDYQQNTGNGNTQNVSPEGSKSNTGLIVGGVALAALPLLFFMKKDKKK